MCGYDDAEITALNPVFGSDVSGTFENVVQPY